MRTDHLIIPSTGGEFRLAETTRGSVLQPYCEQPSTLSRPQQQLQKILESYSKDDE